jgi:single-strand DNA-binding protein
MSGNLNKVILIGNLGNDPEIRNTNDGKEIANFSLATSESWKDKVTGEKKEKTEWHRIVCFNEGLVKIIKEYVKKGTKLYSPFGGENLHLPDGKALACLMRHDAIAS